MSSNAKETMKKRLESLSAALLSDEMPKDMLKDATEVVAAQYPSLSPEIQEKIAKDFYKFYMRGSEMGVREILNRLIEGGAKVEVVSMKDLAAKADKGWVN